MRVRKFTLFFVPLFPVSVKRSVTCVYCGTTTPLDKAATEAYVAQAAGLGTASPAVAPPTPVAPPTLPPAHS